MDGQLLNLRHLQTKSKFTRIGISDLQYADDCVILAHTEADLQSSLNLFANAYHSLGLSLNIGKIKVPALTCTNYSLYSTNHHQWKTPRKCGPFSIPWQPTLPKNSGNIFLFNFSFTKLLFALFYSFSDGNYRQNRSNLTSLLVQPISALLVKRLVSLPEDRSKSDGCIPLKLAMTEKRIISLNVQTVPTYKTISNVIGYLKGSTFPDRYVIVGSHHNSVYGYSGQEWASSTAVITAFIQALMLKVKRGWRPDRTIVFCSWGGTSFGNIGSYEWAEDLKKVLQRNVVAYVSLHNPVRGNSSLHPVASPSLQQLATERQSLTCLGKMKCPGSNVSSVQMQGDSDYFINHLGVPTVQFSHEDIKTLESPSFLFEALFPAHNTVTEELDPLFNLHETIAKLTGEVTLQIASEPVLPFNALDIALEVQNSLKGDQLDTRQLLAMASRLRDSAELFQSDEMRPANDPKERAPIRVRMLNDVLQGLEKNFLVQQAPPGFYRNILYRLDEKMSQFSVLLEALEHCKLHQSNETLQAALSKVLNSINSAQVYFKAGLDVFETAFAGKK
uniref:N-acetylated alpha-linked acidic dipeptidase like 2 n=1 Tax=Chrysemys picta bellii TaxID=8478 RepID=A0A8C3ISJ6_CHRPI